MNRFVHGRVPTTIFYNTQRQLTLNLNSDLANSAYLQVLKRSELKWPRKPGETTFSDPQGQLTP